MPSISFGAEEGDSRKAVTGALPRRRYASQKLIKMSKNLAE
jgi:hypothetical protein